MSRRRDGPDRAVVIGAIALLLLLGAGALLSGAAAATPRFGPLASCPPGDLTATPTAGTAPLVVNFSMQVSSSTTPTYSWSFGDGGSWSGSGSAYANPVHRYASPGLYNASVLVETSSGPIDCAVTVTVQPAPLRVAVTASPPNGSAPLTVRFSASITGGSGTFSSIVWSFGDGGVGSGSVVAYTYVKPGTYEARVTVIDSVNDSTNASRPIFVNATVSTSSSPGEFAGATALTWFAAGAAVTAVATAVAYFLRWAPRWRARSEEVDDRSPTPIASNPAVSAARTTAATTSWERSPSGGARGPRGSEPPPASSPPGELRLSQRVIVHLAGLGGLQDDEVASDGFTQSGMADSLGVPQNRLSNVLRRLERSGVLVPDVRHVSGRARRVKVYRLTPLGDQVARDLWRRATIAEPNAREDSPRTRT